MFFYEMTINPITQRTHWGWHLLAVATILVWGTTFASTKTLLMHGLTPPEIMVERFIIAYLCILPFCHHRLFADTFFDELRMLALGITGGSMYFFTENSALQHTTSSNVALIVCVTPLLASLLSILLFREIKLTRRLAVGSLIALVGEGLVVLNGNFLVEVNPLGDALAFGAALSWAIYTVILRPLGHRYDTLFITRKVFIYGLITMLPILLLCEEETFHVDTLMQPVVWGNLLFLGVVASFGCFFSWNLVLRKLDVVRASNYMYTQPLVSLLCSMLILHEPFTVIAFAGTIFILMGIIVADHGLPMPKSTRK